MSPPRTIDRSSPYPWPYDGCLDGAVLALVVAGWDTGWASRCTHREAVTRNIARLADATDAVGGLVVTVEHHTRERRRREVATAPLGPPASRVGVHHVVAAGIDGFHGSDLDGLLRRHGRTHLVVTGLGYEAPVHSTLRSANDRGFECLTVPDACAPLEPDLVPAATATIEMSGGIFGAVAPAVGVAVALAELIDRRTTTEVPL